MPDMTKNYQSETSKHRSLFLPHIPLCGVLDVGCGGDPVVPWAICCEKTSGVMAQVGIAPIHLDLDCRRLPFVGSSLRAIYSSHMLEDLEYHEQLAALNEWKRCLAPGGIIALLLPDQQRYLAHCRATGQDINQAHKEQNFGLEEFKLKVWTQIPGFRILEARDLEDYSFMFVAQKQ